MRRLRRVKIIATLGPASSEESKIEELARAGADVFRINMSHASHDLLRQTVTKVRNVEARIGHAIGVLVDLQGPKLRIGTFAGGPVQLQAGDTIVLDGNPEPGDASRVHLPHPEILDAVKAGDRLLLDDGKVELRARRAGGGTIECEVLHSGRLSDKKGVSLPDTLLPVGALTDKDRADLVKALEVHADWIALSFVQRPEDVVEVRKIVQGRAGVMAKIEKPQAIERLEEIIKLCDAFMIARGDLGVELPIETAPETGVPLFLVIYLVLLVGVLLGGVATWLAQARVRAERRHWRREAALLTKELDGLRKTPESPGRQALLEIDDFLDRA